MSLAGGKRNEQLILPLNSSLSVTLDQAQVCVCVCVYTRVHVPLHIPHSLLPFRSVQLKATTTVGLSKHYTRDRLWVNGRYEHPPPASPTPPYKPTTATNKLSFAIFFPLLSREESTDNPRLQRCLEEGEFLSL